MNIDKTCVFVIALVSGVLAFIPGDTDANAAVAGDPFGAGRHEGEGLRLLGFADLPFVTPDDHCGQCSPCQVPSTGEMGHVAQQADEGNQSRGDGWHSGGSCLANDCDTEHPFVPECFPIAPAPDDGEARVLSLDQLEEVWLGVRDGTVDPSQVVTTYSRNVEFNAARNALQVIGCTGQVAAHIPIPRDRGTNATASNAR